MQEYYINVYNDGKIMSKPYPYLDRAVWNMNLTATAMDGYKPAYRIRVRLKSIDTTGRAILQRTKVFDPRFSRKHVISDGWSNF